MKTYHFCHAIIHVMKSLTNHIQEFKESTVLKDEFQIICKFKTKKTPKRFKRVPLLALFISIEWQTLLLRFHFSSHNWFKQVYLWTQVIGLPKVFYFLVKKKLVQDKVHMFYDKVNMQLCFLYTGVIKRLSAHLNMIKNPCVKLGCILCSKVFTFCCVTKCINMISSSTCKNNTDGIGDRKVFFLFS